MNPYNHSKFLLDCLEIIDDLEYLEYKYDFATAPVSDFKPPLNCVEVELVHVDNLIWDEIKNALPNTLKRLIFLKSKLDHLVVQEGVEWIFAGDMDLLTIHLPDSTTLASVGGNLLTEIELPHHIESLKVECNMLRQIRVRPGGRLMSLCELDVTNNSRLQFIDFEPPESTKIDIICETYVVLSERLKAAKMLL